MNWPVQHTRRIDRLISSLTFNIPRSLSLPVSPRWESPAAETQIERRGFDAGAATLVSEEVKSLRGSVWRTTGSMRKNSGVSSGMSQHFSELVQTLRCESARLRACQADGGGWGLLRLISCVRQPPTARMRRWVMGKGYRLLATAIHWPLTTLRLVVTADQPHLCPPFSTCPADPTCQRRCITYQDSSVAHPHCLLPWSLTDNK